MSMKKHGGPAFPFEYHNQTNNYQESFATDGMIRLNASEQYMGLSMRDYFAAKAMQGICGHSDTWGLITSEKIASVAYELADAMLKAAGYVE